ERMRTDFVSTVSHELRTPLAAIYGAALTLRREDLPLGADQRAGLLDVIASESDRLARIVNDILWASRVDANTLQVTLERCDVRDEGLGIPLTEQSRIFEKFYRLDPNLTRGVGGTGLGLYICRELVRRMDGAIWVVSREGAGSTFTVELGPA